jgi:hypothetical protein
MQMAWLNQTIADTDPSMKIVTYNHYDFQEELDLNAMGIDMNLYGHIHSDDGSIYNPPYNLATNNVCDRERSFRVIYFNDSGFHPQQTSSAGSSGQNFTVSFSPENNGRYNEVTATITNNYNLDFTNGLVIFNMPIAESYTVDNGRILQTIELDSTELCYARVQISSNSVTTVTIRANTTSTDEENVILPIDLALYQNYPNPFNSTTQIRYSLPTASNIKIEVYNLQGQKVSTLENGKKEPGYHSVIWNAANYSGGIYFYTMTIGDYVATKKMNLVK